jgi:uncharacterized membrane protein
MTEQTEDSATEQSAGEESKNHDSGTQASETHDRAAHGGEVDRSGPDAGQVVREVEFISAERLIFFTDAVVAIAMTLLAFGLTTRVPDTEKIGAVLKALWWRANAWREYLAFLISFVVIGRHWRMHHRQFQYVSRLDARIITLNMVWLLMIVITPFATRLLSAPGGFAIVFSLYAIIQVITILTELLMSRHIRAAGLLRPGAPEPGPRDDDATALVFAAMFAISIPAAFFTESAFVLWVAAAPVSRLVARLRGRS